MAQDEKKILLDVEIQDDKAKEALKAFSALKLEIEELRKSKKELGKVTNENREEYEKYGQQIKALTAESRTYEKYIQSSIKEQNRKEGSLNQLKATLSKVTQEYNNLSESERNATKGKALQSEISSLTKSLKEAEAALGNHRREVGNYALAGQSMKAEIRELTASLASMVVAGERGSKEFVEMTARLAELKGAFSAASQGANALASSTSHIDALSQGVTALAGSFAIYQSALASTIGVSDEYANMMKNLQITITALTALGQIQLVIQKKSALNQMLIMQLTKRGIGLSALEMKKTRALAAMKAKNTLATKALAAATWLWNAALMSNPALILLTAVVALTAAYFTLTKVFSKSAKAQREAKIAMEAYEEQSKKTDMEERTEETAKAAATETDERKNSIKDLRFLIYSIIALFSVIIACVIFLKGYRK